MSSELDDKIMKAREEVWLCLVALTIFLKTNHVLVIQKGCLVFVNIQ